MHECAFENWFFSRAQTTSMPPCARARARGMLPEMYICTYALWRKNSLIARTHTNRHKARHTRRINGIPGACVESRNYKHVPTTRPTTSRNARNRNMRAVCCRKVQNQFSVIMSTVESRYECNCRRTADVADAAVAVVIVVVYYLVCDAGAVALM